MVIPSSRKRSFALQNILLRKALLRSRGTHRARVHKELKSRCTPPILTYFIVKGHPLNNPRRTQFLYSGSFFAGSSPSYFIIKRKNTIFNGVLLFMVRETGHRQNAFRLSSLCFRRTSLASCILPLRKDFASLLSFRALSLRVQVPFIS